MTGHSQAADKMLVKLSPVEWLKMTVFVAVMSGTYTIAAYTFVDNIRDGLTMRIVAAERQIAVNENRLINASAQREELKVELNRRFDVLQGQIQVIEGDIKTLLKITQGRSMP